MISHTVTCKKGGLVTARHNELLDGVADLAGKAFTPYHVRKDPLIYSGRAVKQTMTTPESKKISEHPAALEVTEQKGDLLIRELWQQGTDRVHGMCVVNTDALTYQLKEPEKCLHEAEKRKKKMYLEACIQQRRYFSPFVASVDGPLGVEATATLKRIASRLATKLKQSYSKMCGYVKSRITITLVRATHCCIRGSQVPAQRISVQRPHWENCSGLNLFR